MSDTTNVLLSPAKAAPQNEDIPAAIIRYSLYITSALQRQADVPRVYRVYMDILVYSGVYITGKYILLYPYYSGYYSGQMLHIQRGLKIREQALYQTKNESATAYTIAGVPGFCNALAVRHVVTMSFWCHGSRHGTTATCDLRSTQHSV